MPIASAIISGLGPLLLGPDQTSTVIYKIAFTPGNVPGAGTRTHFSPSLRWPVTIPVLVPSCKEPSCEEPVF